MLSRGITLKRRKHVIEYRSTVRTRFRPAMSCKFPCNCNSKCNARMQFKQSTINRGRMFSTRRVEIYAVRSVNTGYFKLYKTATTNKHYICPGTSDAALCAEPLSHLVILVPPARIPAAVSSSPPVPSALPTSLSYPGLSTPTANSFQSLLTFSASSASSLSASHRSLALRTIAPTQFSRCSFVVTPCGSFDILCVHSSGYF